MGNTVVQINFKFDMSPSEFVETVRPLAEPIAAVTGLQWKLWLMDEANRRAGGVYLFDSSDAVQAYLNGPIVAGLGEHPKITDIAVKVHSVDDELSAITRGPLARIVS
jgi:hypothetical protein